MNKKLNDLLTVFIFFSLLSFLPYNIFPQSISKEVAITIDDLPVVTISRDFQTEVEITENLLKSITENKIPVTGFVIGDKLYKEGELDSNKVNLIKMWLDTGLELGNHTFTHPSLNNTSLDDYKKEVIRCDDILKEVLAAYKKKPEYLRQPYLQFGKDAKKIKDYYQFLEDQSYKMAPVTIDNSDWIFARAFEKAYLDNDSLSMNKIAKAYIPYMKSKFEYYKKQSEKLFGYEIKQILLIHASRLNADYIGDLIKMIRNSGYKIISLRDALTDKAYEHKDNYLGNAGISWLHRWALTEGKKKDFFKGEPLTPEFVKKIAGIKHE